MNKVLKSNITSNWTETALNKQKRIRKFKLKYKEPKIKHKNKTLTKMKLNKSELKPICS